MDDCVQLKEENDAMVKSIADIANELYRFRRVFFRVIDKIDVNEREKYRSQFSWFSKKIDKAVETAGLRVLNVEGQEFDPGMSVTALNIEDFDVDDKLYIDRMMEPIIMKGDQVQKTGTVLLGRIVL